MTSLELKDVELFFFTDILVFESVFYEGGSKIPLLLEIVLRLHQGQMRRYLIFHVVHIAGTIIIEAGSNRILRGNKLGVIMRGLNPLHFF